MASPFWIVIGMIAVVAIVTKGVVRIVTVIRASDGKTSDLEATVQELEEDLADARQRIEVLEKIVTDEKHTLHQEIDDLAVK